MPTVFRPILPKTQTISANSNTDDGVPNTTPPIFQKNPAPCANCSSGQQACLVYPPYSPSLCKKCAREHRDKCPAHMQRTDAVLWKKQELEAEQAAIARRAPIEQGPVSKEDPPTKANANIIYVLPKMAPEATIQLQEGINLHIHDFFESPVTAFGEHFAVPPVTGSGPTMKENHDDVVFNFNELDEQFDLTGIKTDDDLKDLASLMEDEFFEPHLSASVGDLALPPFTASDPTPELNHDEMVLSFNELDQFDPTAMFTTDDNFGGLVSPTDYFEPPTAAFPPFTASDLTPAQHHGEVLFNFNELDQHFDPNSMLTRDENFQDLFSPTEDGIQYLNANFDALWEEFE